MNIEEFIKDKCKNQKTSEFEKALRVSYEKYKHLTDQNEISYELDKARIRYDKGYSMYDELADVYILHYMKHGE